MTERESEEKLQKTSYEFLIQQFIFLNVLTFRWLFLALFSTNQPTCMAAALTHLRSSLNVLHFDTISIKSARRQKEKEAKSS